MKFSKLTIQKSEETSVRNRSASGSHPTGTGHRRRTGISGVEFHPPVHGGQQTDPAGTEGAVRRNRPGSA